VTAAPIVASPVAPPGQPAMEVLGTQNVVGAALATPGTPSAIAVAITAEIRLDMSAA